MHEVQLPPIRPARHIAPATVDDTVALLAELPSARVVAGGTDLLVELDRRVGPHTDVLVDITRVQGLGDIELVDGRVRLGALVTHNQAATHPLLRTHATCLAQASLEVGSPALRNRATVVGNVVTASPANDTISALRALDADVEIRSTTGTRTVPLAQFHLGVRRTALEPGELVTALTFDAIGDTHRSLFLKLGLRRAQAISVVHVAMAVAVDADGLVTDARIALGSVAPTIVRADGAEAGLVGSPLDTRAIEAAGEAAAAAVSPIDDLRAPASYRDDLIPTMVRRGLHALAAGAHADTLPATPPTLGGPSVPADGAATDTDSPAPAIVNGTATPLATAGTLLDALRDVGDLTGTKEGCDDCECGACMVLLDGQPVNSCSYLAVQAQGRSVTTIEGVMQGPEMHALQRNLLEAGGVQCGFCTPGMIMAAADMIQRHGGNLDEATVRAELEGNICRCTGYHNIVKAILAANAEMHAA